MTSEGLCELGVDGLSHGDKVGVAVAARKFGLFRWIKLWFMAHTIGRSNIKRFIDER